VTGASRGASELVNILFDQPVEEEDEEEMG
jgi:hypothetical protein